VVKKGESLSVIARRNGTTVARIKQLNGLKSDNIRIGQRLRLR
jgi:membrane-bound lytic murein transglycosylase D